MIRTRSFSFSFRAAVADASRVLPNQPILGNFVHHNPLQPFETMQFDAAIEAIAQLELHLSPGARAEIVLNFDPRKRTNEALSDLSSAFLDRGAAKWTSQHRGRGFLYFFALHESLGIPPWRKHARFAAKRILKMMERGWTSADIAELILRENLESFVVIPESEWNATVRAMLLEVRGWAGMFHRMASHPEEAPEDAKVSLLEFAAVQSILTRASLGSASGWDIATLLRGTPNTRNDIEDRQQHSSSIAFVNQSSGEREALELEFERTLLHAIAPAPLGPVSAPFRPQVQLYTCIDDRSGSFRRHFERAYRQGEIESFGVAGFFGIPIQYRDADGHDQVGQRPAAVLIESDCPGEQRKNSVFKRRRRFLGHLELAWERASFSPLGSLVLSLFAPFSAARLWLMGFSPEILHRVKEGILNTALPRPRTDFALPFPPDQAAVLLAKTFKVIGSSTRFARIVLVLGHGSQSVNNPFSAAYNCGACSGHAGGPNARLLARLANDETVREMLKSRHDIVIPADSVFIGGLHNTTSEEVTLFDTDRVPESHATDLEELMATIEVVRGENALERCQRFFLASNVTNRQQALNHVKLRSVDAAEPRPELNHASNAAVVVGRRVLTAGHFLDRRVFLSSYDPYSDNAEGTNLEAVLGPALVVCSGINLEYLFSTVDVDHHGAGSKAPLNVVSNIAVLQGTSGDLRPGLPSQMSEMHTPVRALFVIDASLDRVEAVLQRREDLSRLVRNDWIRLLVRDPESGLVFRQTEGLFSLLPAFGNDGSNDASLDFLPFTSHQVHGAKVTANEQLVYNIAFGGMILSCVAPVAFYATTEMNPSGWLIAGGATLLSLPVLAFSRRYLHGEFMFARVAILSTTLLCSFNMVATAPTLEHAMVGWSFFGFASTFLIGAYNDRPTVRNNATFAFAAYRLSDIAMIVATSSALYLPVGTETNGLVAGGLVAAALLKSSQIPLTSLFVRSMEGPTTASALGYAGLSAHLGVVLLASTMPLWFEFDMARGVIGAIGLSTALYGSMVARTRSDRKGSIASATSATLGLIFTILAAGYSEFALLLCFGHAAFRMTQILRAPSIINVTSELQSSLGVATLARHPPDWLYRAAWILRRLDSDFHFMQLLHTLSRPLQQLRKFKFSKWQQFAVTALCVTLAGAPFTPLSYYFEHDIMEMLQMRPVLASLLLAGHFAFSVMTIRFVFVNVLRSSRFKRPGPGPHMK